MAVYLIVTPDDKPGEPKLSPDTVKHNFPVNTEVIKDRVWVVQSNLTTCGRVSEKLGLGAPNQYLGVVFKVTDRYGYHYSAFWEELRAMENATS